MVRSAAERVGTQRPGGRAERVRRAVLTATLEILDADGYAGLSYEAVAERAGVHKTTVYRRWATRPDLVADAVGLHVDVHLPIPDSGSLRRDLERIARSVAATLASPAGGGRSRSVVAASAGSPELAAAVHRYVGGRVRVVEEVVARAVARGEIDEDVDPRLVVEAVIGPIWYRFLLTGEPVDPDLAARVVDLVLKGVASFEPPGRGPTAGR